MNIVGCRRGKKVINKGVGAVAAGAAMAAPLFDHTKNFFIISAVGARPRPIVKSPDLSTVDP